MDTNFFRCRHSNCGFFDKSHRSLMKHLRDNHGLVNLLRKRYNDVSRLRCHYCGTPFESSRHLLRHMITSHKKYSSMDLHSTQNYENKTNDVTTGIGFNRTDSKYELIDAILSSDLQTLI